MTLSFKKRINTELFIDRRTAFYIGESRIRVGTNESDFLLLGLGWVSPTSGLGKFPLRVKIMISSGPISTPTFPKFSDPAKSKNFPNQSLREQCLAMTPIKISKMCDLLPETLLCQILLINKGPDALAEWSCRQAGNLRVWGLNLGSSRQPLTPGYQKNQKPYNVV